MNLIHEIAQFVTTPEFGIVFAFLILIAPVWLKKFRDVGQIQVIVTTAGMLGTFLGIVAGISLLDLEIDKINASIVQLLGGLTTAFLTSIAGLLASLTIQMRPLGFPYYINENENKEMEKEVSLGDVLVELKSLNKNIAGEGDTSLTTQIVKMRSDSNDNFKELKRSFDEFAEKMAKANTEELIKSIKSVMEDFNTKINDQLGESFKELSNSVKNLVDWQEGYVTVVKTSTEALGAAQESLVNSSSSLNNTSEKVSEIAENNQQIHELNIELKLVIDNLNQMLESTVGFSQNIKTLAGSLNESGDTIQTEVKALVEESIKNMQIHAEDISKNINSITDTAMRNMQEKNMETLQNFEEINQKTLQDFGGHLASIAGKMTEDFQKVQEALSIK